MTYSGSDWLLSCWPHWRDRLGKPGAKVSLLGLKVAEILGVVVRGLYHVENEARATDWSGTHHIEIVARSGDLSHLSTYDFTRLTELVVLCHDAAIRLEIAPVRIPYRVEGEHADETGRSGESCGTRGTIRTSISARLGCGCCSTSGCGMAVSASGTRRWRRRWRRSGCCPVWRSEPMPEIPIYERPITLGSRRSTVPTFQASVDGRPTRRLGAIVAPEGAELVRKGSSGPPRLVVPLGLNRGRTVALEADEALEAARRGDYRLEFVPAVTEGRVAAP